MTLTEELEKKITKEMEDKHYPNFSRFAGYAGNGVYCISTLYSTDTRELFLMYVAEREKIAYKKR